MKIAAVQFAPKFGEHIENLRRCAALVTEAAQNNAQLIVLPELVTTGYSFMSKEQAAPFAEVLTSFEPDAIGKESGKPRSPSMNVMYALAKKYHVHIAWGLVEEDHGTGRLFNSQVLMTPEGTFESARKVNLWGNDFLWASEGRSNPPIMKCVFDEGDKFVTKKVGLLICRDVRDKKDDSWKSFYEKGDADIVAFSANWGDGGFPAVTWMEFARDNKAILVVSNRYGKEIPNNFGEGGVCVIMPEGRVHCEGLVWNQDCIVYADV